MATAWRALLGKLVDSGVRGLVYEAAGSVDGGLLDDGAELVRAAGQRTACRSR